MLYSEQIKNFKIKDKPLILGIETSCDETAVSVVKGGREILSDVIISSATEQARFGGVVPDVLLRRAQAFRQRGVVAVLIGG